MKEVSQKSFESVISIDLHNYIEKKDTKLGQDNCRIIKENLIRHIADGSLDDELAKLGYRKVLASGKIYMGDITHEKDYKGEVNGNLIGIELDDENYRIEIGKKVYIAEEK